MADALYSMGKPETYALLHRAQRGDEAAMEALLVQHTGLVRAAAQKFVTGDIELEDLMQTGFIGLVKAIRRFDTGYEVMFSTYAVPLIVGEMKRLLRDHGKIKVSRALKGDIFSLRRFREQFVAEHGVAPHLSQMAEALATDKEGILMILEAEERLFHVSSLDEKAVEEEYEQTCVLGSPERVVDVLLMKEAVMCLTPKERQVICGRFFRDMTQQELGRRLQISQVQVSRIEKKALAKMRRGMALGDG